MGWEGDSPLGRMCAGLTGAQTDTTAWSLWSGAISLPLIRTIGHSVWSPSSLPLISSPKERGLFWTSPGMWGTPSFPFTSLTLSLPLCECIQFYTICKIDEFGQMHTTTTTINNQCLEHFHHPTKFPCACLQSIFPSAPSPTELLVCLLGL